MLEYFVRLEVHNIFKRHRFEKTSFRDIDRTDRKVIRADFWFL